MKQSRRPAFVFLSVIATALFDGVMGYMVPAIRARFSLTLTEAGLFSTMQSVGFFAAMLLCFCVFSALNKPRVMAASLLLLGVCLAGLAAAPSVALLCILFFFTGMCNNTVDTLSNAVLADFTPDAKSRHIGLLQALFSVAGAVSPYFALLLGSDYVSVFFMLSAVSLVSLAVFALGLRRPIRKPWLLNPQGFGAMGKVTQLIKVRGVPILMALSFLSIFVQISLTYFMSSYMQDIAHSETAGAFAVCVLYTGALVGRLAFVRLSRRVNPYRIMAVYNTLAALGIVAMLLADGVTAVALLAFLPGFGLSANFPGIIVEACVLVPEDTSAASALMFFGVNSAVLVAPPIMGAVGDIYNIGVAFAMCAAVLVPVIAISAVLSRNAVRCQSMQASAQMAQF